MFTLKASIIYYLLGNGRSVGAEIANGEDVFAKNTERTGVLRRGNNVSLCTLLSTWQRQFAQGERVTVC